MKPPLITRRHRFALFDFSAPKRFQLGEVRKAFVFKQKASDALVLAAETPLVIVAMLKNAAAFEVMLAHRVFQFLNWKRRHGKFFAEFVPSHSVGVLVAPHVVIIKIGVLVVPQREAQRTPATLLVE